MVLWEAPGDFMHGVVSLGLGEAPGVEIGFFPRVGAQRQLEGAQLLVGLLGDLVVVVIGPACDLGVEPAVDLEGLAKTGDDCAMVEEPLQLLDGLTRVTGLREAEGPVNDLAWLFFFRGISELAAAGASVRE